MITSIHYKNFKALQDATLPLGRFTLIVGANGTGKTTAMKALGAIDTINPSSYETFISKGLDVEKDFIEIEIAWEDFVGKRIVGRNFLNNIFLGDNKIENASISFLSILSGMFYRETESKVLRSFRLFSFDADRISIRTPLAPNLELSQNGENLAGVFDNLRDTEPERFESLNRELSLWFPEYDRILFEVPEKGYRSFLLRTRVGQHKIKAEDLSDGTLLALAYLTIAYLPNPPKIVAFEEPEKGIHPRLLRNIQEAMYRLAYPENYGEKREPIQVIATTHSPYLLDLFKDNPEEIVIASKDEKGVHFERLMDKPHIEEILQDAPLGEVWYSGVLGGVPAHI